MIFALKHLKREKLEIIPWRNAICLDRTSRAIQWTSNNIETKDAFKQINEEKVLFICLFTGKREDRRVLAKTINYHR